MHLSGFLIRTFDFSLFIRRHLKSPKFVSVWEAKLLPHDTDTLTQKSECLRCTYKNNRKLQIWRSPHLLLPAQTVALWEERDCEIVKCVSSLQPLNRRHLELSVARTSISLKAQRRRGAGYGERVHDVLTFWRRNYFF